MHHHHQPSGRGRRHAASRLYPLIALALLAALLIWPPGIASGGTNDLLTTDAPAKAQATPATEPEPESEPESDTEGQNRLLPEDQSGIYLNKFECQGTFGGDFESLLQNCPVIYTVNFEVFGPNLQLMANGGIALERLPAGLYRIREFMPAGYGDPTAFCGIGPTNGPLPAFVPVVVYDGYYEFELGPSQSIYCNWFNISPQPTEIATLYINKHFCPPAAEFDADAASIYDLAANCQAPAIPVAFEVTRNGTRIGGGTASGAPNLLTLSGLPTGAITIIEELPDGFGDPLVFCSVKDELGAARAPLAQAQTDNNRAFWQLNAGDVVFCDWFNIPAPLGTSISVVKYICPAITGAGRQSYDDYAAACTETRADVSFKLDGARTGNPGEQLTDANGQITWAPMEADRYFLTEEVPAGFGTPAVFCSYYLPAALQNRVYEPVPVSSDYRIEFEVRDGEYITCSWFNNPITTGPAASPGAPTTTPSSPDPTVAPGATPATSGGTTSSSSGTTGAGTTSSGGAQVDASAPAALTIRTYRCEPGYAFLDAAAEPAADCTEPVDAPNFELSTFAGSASLGRRLPDIGAAGATFSGLAPGPYRLAAVDALAEDSAFIESCQSTQRDFGTYLFTPFAVVAGDGSVRLSLVAGETLICDWYDVPAPDDQG